MEERNGFPGEQWAGVKAGSWQESMMSDSNVALNCASQAYPKFLQRAIIQSHGMILSLFFHGQNQHLQQF